MKASIPVRILLALLMLGGLASPGLVLGSLNAECEMACCRLSQHCSAAEHRGHHSGRQLTAGDPCAVQCQAGPAAVVDFVRLQAPHHFDAVLSPSPNVVFFPFALAPAGAEGIGWRQRPPPRSGRVAEVVR